MTHRDLAVRCVLALVCEQVGHCTEEEEEDDDEKARRSAYSLLER